jgi:NAD(P)-dependent dehydrogenase (short-subunit alcohol dehydrogenase family)
MAARFLELGARVVICGRRAEVLDETVAEFNGRFPQRAERVVCDVRNPDEVEAMVATIWEAGPLDALVNNAAGNFIARTETLSARAVDAVLGSVLHGTAYVTLACGRRWLQEARRASVLNIVTTYAEAGSGYVVPSAMGKAGVLALTRSLAVEWGGRGIRSNAIAPGVFPTDGAMERLVPSEAIAEELVSRNPLGRFGNPRELGDAAAFLLSDMSSYINGECLVIDGGERLAGAGQFNLLRRLSDADWEGLKPKRKS